MPHDLLSFLKNMHMDIISKEFSIRLKMKKKIRKKDKLSIQAIIPAIQLRKPIETPVRNLPMIRNQMEK